MQITPAPPPTSRPSRWADVAIAVGLALAYAWFCLAHPIRVNLPIFDEMFTFPSAREIAAGLPAFEQTHPPLTKLLMGLGYWTYQHLGLARSPDEWTNVGIGARLFSPLAAGAGLALTYALGRAMSGRRAVGLLAAGLLACDGVYSVMARVALTNIYAVCFILLGALATWLALDRDDPRWLWLTGTAFGLGMASRWTSVVAFTLLAALVLAHLRGHAAWRRWLLTGVASCVALPLAIYAATYVQPLVAFHGWHWAVLLQPATWGKLVEMQQFMVAYHKDALPLHPCASPWWSWPLMLKPAWFWYASQDRGVTLTGVLAIGNAFVWWASVPAMGYAAYRGFAKHERPMAFLAVLAAGLWLVWPLARANTSFLHYMLEAIPFVCLILAVALQRAWNGIGNVGPVVVCAYAFLVGWWFWYYQPLLTGTPLPLAAYVERLWLGPERWDMNRQMWAYRVELGLQDDAKFKAFKDRVFPAMGSYLNALTTWEQPAGLPAAKSPLGPSPSPSPR